MKIISIFLLSLSISLQGMQVCKYSFYKTGVYSNVLAKRAVSNTVHYIPRASLHTGSVWYRSHYPSSTPIIDYAVITLMVTAAGSYVFNTISAQGKEKNSKLITSN